LMPRGACAARPWTCAHLRRAAAQSPDADLKEIWWNADFVLKLCRSIGDGNGLAHAGDRPQDLQLW
jgi:hypothetical protein